MGKKTSLKATLQGQQARLKSKQKASHAAEVAEQRAKGKGRDKGKDKAPPRPTIPFNPTDKILLIGEGNFSFTHALVFHPPPVLADLPPSNVTATAYDSEDECYVKYPDAKTMVEALEHKGVEILFGIDATHLEKVLALKGKKWNRIVWNFPHAGKGITNQDRNILSNQVLILDFLRSASKSLVTGSVPVVNGPRKRKNTEDEESDANMSGDEETTQKQVAERGTILITLRNVAPYTGWDVPRLAKNPPKPKKEGALLNPCFILLRSFVFYRALWKGYEHRMTKGERAHGQGKTGEGGEDRTWEF
ncbi:hypothetical protein CONPUDRAFT_116262 [Coniophora puteana RWD-64-598 SS2]|uniref:25S rRNA (uridine-N(3))-methyltransferase BMT5-like domain-containing protein n=1 Tax=Coniophora puteana (strain RWD-64-598) TaxID=741705 RepID=A0A5M3N6T4_CONPW|nr:uncharacterized protein CONPUDRAFT_116262 [Coniophora puteana RWD-64-598 SS2]EIW87150.1 hypothetical protein CONPUDRAFT_116262 [Coniophora puteana RWD-64-598 SS2]